MMALLNAMGLVMMTWFVECLVFVGLGLAAIRMAGLRVRSVEHIIGAFWIGFAVTIAILQLWYCFLPVGRSAWLAITGTGLLSASWFGSRCFQILKDKLSVGVRSRFVIGLAALAGFGAIVWMANRAIGPLYPPYDTGLYHLHAVKWISNFSVVPGLGNLHVRFATMSSYFIFMAMLDAVPWGVRCWHTAHGVLMTGAIMAVTISGVRLVLSKSPEPRDIFRFIFLPVLVRLLIMEPSSMAYDLPSFLVGMCVGGEYIQFLLRRKGIAPDAAKLHVFIIVVLSTAAVTIRMNFALIGLCAIGFVLFSLWREFFFNKHMGYRWAIVPFLMACVLLGTSMTQNSILGGYPLSPSTRPCLNVDWRVPAKVMQDQNRVNLATARMPKQPYDAVLADWGWFKPWLKGVVGYYHLEMNTPLLIAVGGILFALLLWASGAQPSFLKLIVLLMPAIVGILFWILTAPQMRLAGACFYWIAGGVLAWLMNLGRAKYFITVLVLILGLGLTVFFNIHLDKFMGPGTEKGFHAIPKASVHPFTTDSGLVVYVPDIGDQGWDAPLPSTPYPKAELRLRKPGDMASGFRMGQ